MSRLTEALDRIGNYLQQHAPEVFATLQPGLSYEEIEEIVKDLPFRLPPEVYELYQWRNGSDCSHYDVGVFKADDDYGLYPLEYVVENVLVGGYSSYREVGLFFRIMQKGGYILIDEELSTCRVILGRDYHYEYSGYQYTSLTNMMLTIAECYETGAYNKEPVRSLSQPDLETTQIWWKYNYDIKDILLKKLQTKLSNILPVDMVFDIVTFEDLGTVDIMIQRLQDTASETTDAEIIRAQAAEVLGKIGDVKAVEPLIRALQDESEHVRMNVAYSLTMLKDERAIKPLIHALEKNTSEEHLPSEIAGALAELRAVEPLIEILHHKKPNVRLLAAWTLGRIGDRRAIAPLSQFLQDDERATDQSLFCTLANIKAVRPAGAALIELKAVDALVEALNHNNPIVRREAAWALGEIGDKRAVEPLSQLLEDADSDVRETVREALEAIDPTSKAIAQREETPKSGIFQKFPISPITPIAPISPIGPISGITPISPIGPIPPITF